MSGASKGLPSNRREWESMVKSKDLVGKTVHAAELASGSKIGINQHLLFRVLWVDHRSNLSLPEGIKKMLPKARELLAGYESWGKYLGSFETTVNPESTFALARHQQQKAANSRENTRPNSFDTPVALRTRSKQKDKAPDISKLQLNPPKTPLGKQSKQPETPVLSISDDDWVADDDQSPSQMTPITPAAQAPEELQTKIYPATRDEQIVNTALVLFLDALTVHFPDCKPCEWTLHRKGFQANFTQASFEARTDGYLDDGQENACALIEVKPVIRGKTQNLIQMQESAQMVAWLMHDSDKNNIDKIRIHVSQDRHEIFLVFAEYDDDYLAYLKSFKTEPLDHKSSESQISSSSAPMDKAPSFLTMHQYGPWDTRHKSHMERLGPVLLAITLYAAGEIKAKRTLRRK